MTRDKIFNITFQVSFLLLFSAIVIKVFHKPGPYVVFAAFVIATLIYTVIALSEVYDSDKVSKSIKVLWTLGFIFLPLISGLIYFFKARPWILPADYYKDQNNR